MEALASNNREDANEVGVKLQIESSQTSLPFPLCLMLPIHHTAVSLRYTQNQKYTACENLLNFNHFTLGLSVCLDLHSIQLTIHNTAQYKCSS